jgi:hypothetical protein
MCVFLRAAFEELYTSVDKVIRVRRWWNCKPRATNSSPAHNVLSGMTASPCRLAQAVTHLPCTGDVNDIAIVNLAEDVCLPQPVIEFNSTQNNLLSS